VQSFAVSLEVLCGSMTVLCDTPQCLVVPSMVAFVLSVRHHASSAVFLLHAFCGAVEFALHNLARVRDDFLQSQTSYHTSVSLVACHQHYSVSVNGVFSTTSPLF